MTVMAKDHRNLALIKGLTFLMFMMFAMTTDAVGVIIPEVIKEFDLSMTAAGAFHYTTMTAIALSGILLGHLADRLGRKTTIIAGLSLFAISSFLFAAGHTFGFFLALLVVSGTAIGIFKTGALALVGDITTSDAGTHRDDEHGRRLFRGGRGDRPGDRRRGCWPRDYRGSGSTSLPRRCACCSS